MNIILSILGGILAITAFSFIVVLITLKGGPLFDTIKQLAKKTIIFTEETKQEYYRNKEGRE